MNKPTETLFPAFGCENGKVKLRGYAGDMEKNVLNRLVSDAFNYDFLMADLNFNQKRWFTNYSGDVSGRYLEVMSRASAGNPDKYRVLKRMREDVPALQREDGHFGTEAHIDWAAELDNIKDNDSGRLIRTALLWGNSRILLGLIEAYLAFGDEKCIASAKKLGDFYIDVSNYLTAPDRVAEFHLSGSSPGGYSTCWFPAVEGLVRLYKVTNEEKYLNTAAEMAEFRHKNNFDKLPCGHSHGYLCAAYGELLLYAATGEDKYLNWVEKSWNELVSGGYVSPAGGLLERAVIGDSRDEGCSNNDWFRLNLELARITKNIKYWGMAERTFVNAFAANQYDTGGFGHRRALSDGLGQFGYGMHIEEALWCCTFHGGLGTQLLKYYLVSYDGNTVSINLPFEFEANFDSGLVIEQKNVEIEANGVLLAQQIIISGEAGAGVKIKVNLPEWADKLVIADGGAVAETTVYEHEIVTKQAYGPGSILDLRYYGEIITENRFCGRAGAVSPADNVVFRRGANVLTLRGTDKITTVTLNEAKTRLLPFEPMQNSTVSVFVFGIREM
jgi:DUF1680 family protein